MKGSGLGRVLSIGRSDCIGSAGVQGDAKVITMMGGYASSVLTSVTARDGGATPDTVELSASIIVRQMETILHAVGTDCLKVGSLTSAEQIDVIAATFRRLTPDTPLVIAPALLTFDGSWRMSTRTLAAFKRRFMLEHAMMTLPVDEAEMLTGLSVADLDQLSHIARMLLTLGNRAVFVHGAHFGNGQLTDILVTEDDLLIYDDAPLALRSIYGVRNALAAAVATGLSLGCSIKEAVDRARQYVHLGAQPLIKSKSKDRCTLDFRAGLVEPN